jgi:hypothetical protein
MHIALINSFASIETNKDNIKSYFYSWLVTHMKILMLWNYYPEILVHFYTKYPLISSLSYNEHRLKILDEHYGWPSELASFMLTQNFNVNFIIGNDEALQKKWACENSITYDKKNWEKAIIYEQIKIFQPDILWTSSIFHYYGDFLLSLKKYTKKIIAWIGSPFLEKIDTRGISVLLTENQATLRSFHKNFEKVIVTTPGFDPLLLKLIPPQQEKKYFLTFIGSITSAHKNRLHLLNDLLKKHIPLTLFCRLDKIENPCIRKKIEWAIKTNIKNLDFYNLLNDIKKIIDNYKNFKVYQAIAARSHTPIFGIDMYNILTQSTAILNVHIDCAGSNSGNMRLFETTGMGTCIITEKTKNIGLLFEPNTEIITYETPQELNSILKELEKNPGLANKIGAAGQARILKQHTISHMFNNIKEAFNF